jgi:heme-degrading monooxygenase HmoA
MIAHAEEALTAAQGLHAAQPGYAGSIVVADGQRFIAVNLWRTQDDASAGRGRSARKCSGGSSSR